MDGSTEGCYIALDEWMGSYNGKNKQRLGCCDGELGMNEREEVCMVGLQRGEGKMDCVRRNRVNELVLPSSCLLLLECKWMPSQLTACRVFMSGSC